MKTSFNFFWFFLSLSLFLIDERQSLQKQKLFYDDRHFFRCFSLKSFGRLFWAVTHPWSKRTKHNPTQKVTHLVRQLLIGRAEQQLYSAQTSDTHSLTHTNKVYFPTRGVLLFFLPKNHVYCLRSSSSSRRRLNEVSNRRYRERC